MTDAETPPEASIEERFRIIHDHSDLVDQTLDELAGEFETELEEQNDSYVIEIPSRELHQGDLQHGETYKVALISTLTAKNEFGQP